MARPEWHIGLSATNARMTISPFLFTWGIKSRRLNIKGTIRMTGWKPVPAGSFYPGPSSLQAASTSAHETKII